MGQQYQLAIMVSFRLERIDFHPLTKQFVLTLLSAALFCPLKSGMMDCACMMDTI